MGDVEETERRVAMAERLVRVEVTLVNQHEQLTRIERLLGQQATSMEKMMGEFTQKIDNLETSIEEKIDPLKEQVSYWKGALWILGGVVLIVVGVVLKLWLGV